MVRSMKVETPTDSGASLRALLAEVFGDDDVVLPAHIDALLRLYAPLPDQRPATCGAYALTYLLPARGFGELDGDSLNDEDFMAHLAADTIEAREVAGSAAIQARVDRGELTEAEALIAHRRDWYRYPIDSSAEPSEVGTSPDGVARAIALASGGLLATVPIAGRDASGRVQLDPRRWDTMLDLVASDFAGGEVDILFNYESDQLLDARDHAYNAENLRRSDAATLIPLDRWGVGHFVPMAALWRRPSGERWLVLLNSFKERAFAGVELQPAELVRRGVVREDGRGGGVLLVITRRRVEAILAAVENAGLTVAMWSNGSRPPANWSWARGR